MTRRATASAVPILACWAAMAWLAPGCAFADPVSCTQAADIAEQRLGLPSGLLRSIGEVETGNRPWSVDNDGSGVSFASADDAIAYVRRGAASARYVDVGCFQIDLAFHPDAFRTLEEAFDPVANATAAGRFLVALRRTAASWPQAVARYHAAGQARGGAYAARVYAALGPGASDATFDTGEMVSGIRIVVPSAYRVAQDGSARGSGRVRVLPVVQTP